MSDLYTEIIVKKKKTALDRLKKWGMIVVTVLAVAATLLFGLPGLILLIAMAVADYFLILSFDVEYEYLYVNGELDVDKVMSKQKRKRIYSCDVKDLVVMAPVNSHELDAYRNRQEIKKKDFSSGEPDSKAYGMVIKTEKGMDYVLFEPNDTILKDMKRLSPREVFMY
ncbi:MAG: DUF6106 family protein [Muricoprocola sp.]